MFSMFQFLCVLFVIFLALCAYIGRSAAIESNEAVDPAIAGAQSNDVFGIVALWINYIFTGFRKVFASFSTLFAAKAPTQTENGGEAKDGADEQ